LLIVVIVSVALMFLDHRYHHTDNLRAWIETLIYPLRYVVNVPDEMGQWASNTLVSRDTLLEQNATLRRQNKLLTAELQKYAFLESENRSLRGLLKSAKRMDDEVLIAELLSVEMDPYRRQVVINKGSKDKVYVGQPVVDAQGVMGKIVHVGLYSSTALLITDPNHSLPVQINRNGLRAIAVGTGAEDQLEIPYQPNNADIKVGDLLVTSGLGCVFPAGYPAARIVEIKTDPALPFAQIKAEPTADLSRSRMVLLVWPKNLGRGEDQKGCKAVAEASHEAD
jgi:rod shape-determining protein MreC